MPFTIARSATTRTLAALLLAAAVASLVVPARAHALMVGAEANGELINSDRTPALQAEALDKLQAQGTQVVRINMGWNEIAANCGKQSAAAQRNPNNPCYTWGVLDSFVQLATERNIKVLMSTSRAPEWLQPRKPRGTKAEQRPYYLGTTSAQFNRTVTYYSAFLAAAGARYKTGSAHGTIPYWTVWNEPNSNYFFLPKPDANRYALLYAKSAIALKKAFPGAKVAPGPTGPKSTIKPVDFIQAFQKSVVKYLPKRGAKKYINAWAHNPYPGKYGVRGMPSGTYKGTAFGALKGALGMADTPKLIKLLDSKPITKGIPVWGTEFGWETPPDNSAFVVSPALQAQYLAEAFQYFASLKRVAIAINYGLTDASTVTDWQSGTFTADGAAKPSFFMFQRPIATSAGSTKIGSTVKVYGRSNVAPAAGRLVYRTTSPLATTACTALTTDFCWQYVKNAKRAADGSWAANVKITGTETYFAIYDGVSTTTTADSGYGYYRRVLAR